MVERHPGPGPGKLFAKLTGHEVLEHAPKLGSIHPEAFGVGAHEISALAPTR
jgi:hypothetical protein